MTAEEVNKIIKLLDDICVLAKQPTITSILESVKKPDVPNEMMDIVMGQIKEDIAAAMQQGVAETKTALDNLAKDPAVLEKIKEAQNRDRGE
jgi:hypothetical protein